MHTDTRSGEPRSLIIAAASARALAASAVNAGYRVFCADCFGDHDLRMLLSQGGGSFLGTFAEFSDLPKLLDSVPAGIPLLWAGGFENQLPSLTEIARHRSLLGLPLDVVHRLRQPELLASLFAPSRSPQVHFPESVFKSLPPAGRWLWKSRLSSGGLGVQRWTDDLRQQWAGTPTQPDGCFQQEVDGLPCSILVAIDRGLANIIGLSLQFSGWPELNAGEFRFCGNLGPLNLPPRLAAALGNALQRLLEHIEIRRGIFGVDLLLTPHQCWLLEINPRIPASHWIYETPDHWNAVRFAAGEPCSELCHPPRPPLRTQLILWSHSPLQFPGPEESSLPAANGLQIADCPAPDTRVSAGTPICSILVEHTPNAAPENLLATLRQFPEPLARQLQFQPHATADAMQRHLQQWGALAVAWS
ncbi:MAG: ATP-grasp domain-containing protein [Planctomycetota bacterium]